MECKVEGCHTEARAGHRGAAKGLCAKHYQRVRRHGDADTVLHSAAETRAKISAANKGRTVSAETRAKISAALRGHKNNLGKTRSAKTRAKISAALKGRTLSAETRAKIGAASKRRTHSAEAIAKISAAHIKRHRDRAGRATSPQCCTDAARRRPI
jgi:hypothetical protein